MTRNVVTHPTPAPAKRRWQPVTVTRPAWERQAAERWRGKTLPVTPRYEGESRLRAKRNARIREEAER